MMENNNAFSFMIALPMYNEENYAARTIRAVNAVLRTIENRNAIVAINDGSKDNTLNILFDLNKEIERLIIINHPINRGYGGAIISAYEYAIENHFDYVLFMDADLTQDPHSILEFLPKMAKGIDVIKASRYIKGSQVIGVPKKRIFISTLGNIIGRLAFHLPITDYTNGYRAVKTSVAKSFILKSKNFSILIEEMWQAKYYAKSYEEVSYTLCSRFNETDSKFSYNFSVYKQYLKYCLFSLFSVKPIE